MSLCKDDADLLKTIWAKSVDLADDELITNIIVNKAHKAEMDLIKARLADSRHPFEILAEYSVPEVICKQVGVFFEISEDVELFPFTNIGQPIPSLGPFSNLGQWSMASSSSSSSVSSSSLTASAVASSSTTLAPSSPSTPLPTSSLARQSVNCFLTLLSIRKVNPSELHFNTILGDLQRGTGGDIRGIPINDIIWNWIANSTTISLGAIKEALVLLKCDMSQQWIKQTLSKRPTIFLYPFAMEKLSTEKRSSFASAHKSSKKKRIGGAGTEDTNHCLVYLGPSELERIKSFYTTFQEFGLCPGLNAEYYRN